MRKIGLNLLILGGIFFCLLSGAELRADFNPFSGSPLQDGENEYYLPLYKFQKNNLDVNLKQRENSLLEAVNSMGYQTKFHADSAWQEAIQSFMGAYKRAEEQQNAVEAARPNESKGTNPDGTPFLQYSGRFDIFRDWIEDKMKDFGVFDQWEGENFEELAKKYSKAEFSLTLNKDSDVYIGNNSVMQQKTVFQFSFSNEDKFDEYIQSRSIQKIWDSIKNDESEVVQHSITDNMVWSGKFYDTRLDDKTVVSKRQLISSRQRTWDETHNTYSESTQTNAYIDDTDRAFKTTRHVFERGFDENNKRYEREYDIIRDKISWEWVSSGDPNSLGRYETKSFNQTMVDYSTPDKKTFSHHEFTYSKKTGLAETQLITTHETAPGIDRIYTTLEKYLDYYEDGQASKQLTFNIEGSFTDMDTAIREGKALQAALTGDKALGNGLDLSKAEDLKIYAGYVSKVMELVSEGKDVNTALDEVINSGGEAIPDALGRRINVAYSEKKYNDKGFLAWEKEISAVRGRDKDGTELNFSQEVEKTYKAFTPFGQPTEIKQVIKSEVTPDVETTIEMMIEYDQYGKVTSQRTEVKERGLNGKDLNTHTVTIKNNIVYDSAGLELSYCEEETQYNSSGDIMGHSVRETSNITYNEDGLMSGYDMHTVVNGTDTQDNHEFIITTDTKLMNILYNDLGIRKSWTETTVNSASPGLTTENTYTVTQTDRFGRITELKISEHSYGTANGTSLDTERTITRIISYNSLGQEEKAYEEVLEGKKTTKSTITNEYDEYGRLSKETREVKVSGEDKDDKGKTVTLDYSYTMTRTDFEYNNAGMVQHYHSDIKNESSPDLKITQEVWLGYSNIGQVDYEKTDMWEIGTSKKTDKDGVVTEEDEEVNRHTVSVKHDINYNGLGQEISYITDTKEEKGTEVMQKVMG
ncbi:MAG: hypothetical protein NTZ48_04920 [Candidatus Omnitrophica bacterium]|nr:hypothetical protein [Candidatus Omnitrophota bacterium]